MTKYAIKKLPDYLYSLSNKKFHIVILPEDKPFIGTIFRSKKDMLNLTNGIKFNIFNYIPKYKDLSNLPLSENEKNKLLKWYSNIEDNISLYKQARWFSKLYYEMITLRNKKPIDNSKRQMHIIYNGINENDNSTLVLASLDKENNPPRFHIYKDEDNALWNNDIAEVLLEDIEPIKKLSFIWGENNLTEQEKSLIINILSRPIFIPNKTEWWWAIKNWRDLNEHRRKI